jgi:hypothetical protein
MHQCKLCTNAHYAILMTVLKKLFFFLLLKLLHFKIEWGELGDNCIVFENFTDFTVEIAWWYISKILTDYCLRHFVNNVAIHMITLEWRYLYCIWKFHCINCRFHKVHAHYRHKLFFSGDFQGQEGVHIMHQCTLCNPNDGAEKTFFFFITKIATF